MAETRVTGGEWRGRVITTPHGMPLRPTRSMVREALFNILRDDVDGAQWVDIYAGAGSVGFEALSRGAAQVWFIEREVRHLALIRETAERFACQDRAHPVRSDAHAWLRGAGRAVVAAADVVFLDAPYKDDEAVAALELVAVNAPGRIVCEHHRGRPLPDRLADMIRVRRARYGLNDLSFWVKSDE